MHNRFKILKMFLSGEINPDFKKHKFDFEGLNSKVEEAKKVYKKIERELSDNTLATSFKRNGYVTAQDFESILEVYQDRLHSLFPIINNKLIISLNSSCQYCNVSFVEVSVDISSFETKVNVLTETIPAIYKYSDKEHKKVVGIIKEGKYEFIELNKECEYAELDSISEIINVDENLIFTNFFTTSEGEYPEDLENDSINNLSGRKKLADKYASKNVLYGQTGNMSVYIYQKEDEITILSSDLESLISEVDEYDLSDLELSQIEQYKSWKYKGRISCEVWRYMATSRNNINKLNLVTEEDDVEVKLTSGKYEMKHSYGVKNNGLIVSTIKKV